MALTVKHRFISPKAEQVDPTLVGPNEWNDLHIVVGGALPFLVSSDFIFSAQSPGGILNIGANSLVLNPVPQGVVVGSTLYVSGGIGTAEAVPVTGLTGSTAIITCVNTHTGAWTIQSASSGIQEAINTLGAGGGLIYIPVGTWTVYTTISIKANSVTLAGANSRGTNLTTTYTGGPLLSYTTVLDQCCLRDIGLQGPGTGTNFALNLVDQGNFRIERLSISGFHSGISITGQTTGPNVYDTLINPIGGDAVWINTTVAGGQWVNCGFGGNNTNTTIGFHVRATVGLVIINCYTNSLGYGMVIDPQTGDVAGVIEAFNFYSDGFSSVSQIGILLAPGGGNINTLFFINGAAAGYVQSGIDTGISAHGTIQDLVFRDMYVVGNTSDGITLVGVAGNLTIQNVSFIDCIVEGNGNLTRNGCYFQLVKNLMVRGGIYAAGAFGGGSNTQVSGIVIAGGITNGVIDGAIVTPNNTNTINIAGTNPGLIVKNCTGYNPVGTSTITVGGSPFTYTAGFSPETVYVQGGTISSITIGGRVIANATAPVGQSVIIPLIPNESLVITYSVVPTMFKDAQ